MTIKSTVFKAVLTSLVICSPTYVLANKTKLKVAVIQDAPASQAIRSGYLETSIKKLNRKNTIETTFENNMGLCVAYLQSKNFIKSESACTAAIESIKSLSLNSNKAQYLKSLSYSNRGVSRYLSKNESGAIDDLTAAILIDSNHVTQSNLKLMTSPLFDTKDSMSNDLSD